VLHAFNQKNVQRIEVSKRRTHKNEKSEDAVTSMVFSPLAFMDCVEAFEALKHVIGNRIESIHSYGEPLSHEIILWPQGLKAAGWDSEKATRCEPDLLARFQFQDSGWINLVGEMKWDWKMGHDELAKEVNREKSAVAATFEGEVIPFILTKHRNEFDIKGTPVLTWSDVGQRLRQFARNREKAAGLWAREVSKFLDKANIEFFDGFEMIEPNEQIWAISVANWEYHT